MAVAVDQHRPLQAQIGVAISQACRARLSPHDPPAGSGAEHAGGAGSGLRTQRAGLVQIMAQRPRRLRHRQLIEDLAEASGMNAWVSSAIRRIVSAKTNSTVAMRSGRSCAAPTAPARRRSGWPRRSPRRSPPGAAERLYRHLVAHPSEQRRRGLEQSAIIAGQAPGRHPRSCAGSSRARAAPDCRSRWPGHGSSG